MTVERNARRANRGDRVQVRFVREHSWAILPFKTKIDAKTAKSDAEMYQNEFRWVRRSRAPELCWPWRLGQELGWLVPSPVDVRMTPITDTEVPRSTADNGELSRIFGGREVWNRENSSLVIPKTPWLRLYDFRVSNGWQTMFIPNGLGSVEWQLGWSMEIPHGYYVLVLPLPNPQGVEVEQGVFSAKVTQRLKNSGVGMSIAIRPITETFIQRRQPIARLVLLHEDSLKATEEFCP